MSNDKILTALRAVFAKHRIVFWYDAKSELLQEFEALELEGVEKIELENNEFSVKYRILREQPEQKFLIYKSGAEPEYEDNWLLDVQLSHGIFHTDQAALWLAEVDLGIEFLPLVKEHEDFFTAKVRKEGLKARLDTDCNFAQVRMAMLAQCVESSTERLDAILELLLQEVSKGDDSKFRLLERCNLTSFLWEQMQRVFQYRSSEPSIKDFALTLFKDCYNMGLREPASLNNEALVFLKRWKDSRQHSAVFEYFSNECADVLNIESDLQDRKAEQLGDLDYFRNIDQKVIHDLAKSIANRTLGNATVNQILRQRRHSYWYTEFEHLYEALNYAATFMDAFAQTNLEAQSLADAFMRYKQSWYNLDQLYRKFVYHTKQSAQPSLLKSLNEQIENFYSNQYLLKLGDGLQGFVDQLDEWALPTIERQDGFFKRWVQPFIDKEHRVCVIVSDALRYEIGDELVSLIRREDRYTAEIDAMLAMLPSYTQLGMAALLPHQQLQLKDDSTVLLDGQSSAGLNNRTRALQPVNGAAITYEEFMQYDRERSREFIKQAEVIYIYHNRIDHTGDKIQSEGSAFAAAEESMQELLKLLKKLNAANLSNVLITADHGFIYQNRELDESDFLSENTSFDEVLFRNRRFVLGKGSKAASGLHSFSSSKLGLAGDIEVQIPKSINRLRLQGSGSRFVHGGASLQEIVVPVIKVNKKRQSDTSLVTVDVVRSGRSVITTGQLALTFYQVEPVTDKVHERTLLIGIYTKDGVLISDERELTFDVTSENPRDRELKISLVLSRKADDFNGQDVVLSLREKHEGTTHYKEYSSVIYQIQRSFTSDFDF